MPLLFSGPTGSQINDVPLPPMKAWVPSTKVSECHDGVMVFFSEYSGLG
jgi:hypothetical protein